jgi:uncharacterized repeat protein (TIGR04076 family)
MPGRRSTNFDQLCHGSRLRFWALKIKRISMGTLQYDIEVEIYRGDGCDHHRVGEKFKYPEEIGGICPWLLDSLNAMMRALQFGGSLPWRYQNTEFEKHIDPQGTTTEFVRCPDPTAAGVVAKITRRRRETPREVGWS